MGGRGEGRGEGMFILVEGGICYKFWLIGGVLIQRHLFKGWGPIQGFTVFYLSLNSKGTMDKT